MMYNFENLGFIFIIGGTIGFILEFFFAAIFINKRFVKTGFLFGPFNPIYGFGFLSAHIIFNSSLFISLNIYLSIMLKIIILTGLATLFELIVGIIYLKFFKTRLWDYSKFKFNFKGIINPLFTFFWFLIALCYYLILYNPINNLLKSINGNIIYRIVIIIIIILIIIDALFSFIACIKNKKYFTSLHLTYVEYKEMLFRIYKRKYVIKLFKC